MSFDFTDEQEEQLRSVDVHDSLVDIIEQYAKECSDRDGSRYLVAGLYRAAAVIRSLHLAEVKGESLGGAYRAVYRALDGTRVKFALDASGRTIVAIEGL